MKEKLISTLGRGLAITALATLGAVSTAHAGWNDYYGETGISGSGYFTHLGSGGQSAQFDASQYSAVNLGPLSAALWAPKPGAQGPMRDEHASMKAMQDREIQSRLGPIGGRGTP